MLRVTLFSRLQSAMLLNSCLLLCLLFGGVACAPAGGGSQRVAAVSPTNVGDSGRGEDTQPMRERIGLATRWGEDLSSAVSEVEFTRADSQPDGVATINYNDEAGIDEIFGFWDRLRRDPLELFDETIRIGLVDKYGKYYPGKKKGAKFYVKGELGERYSIRIENKHSSRIETVVSVDGLDVIDGKPAAYANRGYIIGAGEHLVIQGFRKSAAEVAAFRFGEVPESYAQQTNQDTANVGVIGVALFHERGQAPIGKAGEKKLREQADPFPASRSFATPPPKSR